MSWLVHTGPFPVVAPTYDGEIWLWRITNSIHFTAVFVKFAREVGDADQDALAPRVRDARSSRGRAEVERCLRWAEPPREIEFTHPSAEPSFWGGSGPA